MVLSVGDRFGNSEAVVDGSLRLTFTQLVDRVLCAAGAFVDLGVAKGDRIAIWAPNSAEWMIAAFGLLTIAWEVANRRRVGSKRPLRSTVLTDALPAFVCVVGVGAVVYLVSWAGWLIADAGWSRGWANAGWHRAAPS